MNIYVVKDDVDNIAGVYSTREKAEACIEKEIPTFETREKAVENDPQFEDTEAYPTLDEINQYQEDFRESYSIEEFELDV